MNPFRDLTPAERVDALAARGIMLYADAGTLRARCAPEARPLLHAAGPMLARHRRAILDHLQMLATAAALRPRSNTPHP